MGPLKGVPWLKDGEGLGGAAARNTYRMALAFVPAFFHHDTQKTMVEAGKVTLLLMFIIANALLFAHVLTTERVLQTNPAPGRAPVRTPVPNQHTVYSLMLS